ncbi:hypothetical protein [Streptomyces syringium]|uniref:hypothetical protein n=1 Tax=Streptomyces syringium TaxID=76729 RepID=UPI003437F3B1
MPTSPADSCADARRLIEALPRPLPQGEARCADAVQGALLASGLLDSSDLGSSPAVAAATRDASPAWRTCWTRPPRDTAPGSCCCSCSPTARHSPLTPPPTRSSSVPVTLRGPCCTSPYGTRTTRCASSAARCGSTPTKRTTTTAPGRREVDGICLLVSDAIMRLETDGWRVEIADEGLRLANGKLNHLIAYRDWLTSLVDRGDTNDTLWTLRRAKSAHKRPAS